MLDHIQYRLHRVADVDRFLSDPFGLFAIAYEYRFTLLRGGSSVDYESDEPPISGAVGNGDCQSTTPTNTAKRPLLADDRSNVLAGVAGKLLKVCTEIADLGVDHEPGESGSYRLRETNPAVTKADAFLDTRSEVEHTIDGSERIGTRFRIEKGPERDRLSLVPGVVSGHTKVDGGSTVTQRLVAKHDPRKRIALLGGFVCILKTRELRVKIRWLVKTAGQSDRHPESGKHRTSTWHK